MATPPIPSIPQPSLFTLAPRHLGGRRALKGFEFQTAYIAYVLSGFAAGKEDFASCRVEAVEDLDALVKIQETWVERYYQIKSKQEGLGKWTLSMLDREGVLAGFFSLFRRFRLAAGSQNRRIELVLVVDGELDEDLVQLRDKSVNAADSKIKLFALLWSQEVIFRDGSFGPFANEIRNFCRANAHLLLADAGRNDSASDQLDLAFGGLSTRMGAPVGVVSRRLLEAGGEVAPLLDEFVGSLRFDSRVGSRLNEATFGRLIEAGDLSPDEARKAFDHLRRSVQEESALLIPKTVNGSVLREWLGVPKRALLQTKPAPGIDAVERRELLDEILSISRTDYFVLLYGLSKNRQIAIRFGANRLR